MSPKHRQKSFCAIVMRCTGPIGAGKPTQQLVPTMLIVGGFLGHKVGDGKLASTTGAAIGAYSIRELGRRTL